MSRLSGREMPRHQVEALKRASIPASSVIDNLDELNRELEESFGDAIEKPQTTKVAMTNRTDELDAELEAIQKKAAAVLEEKKRREQEVQVQEQKQEELSPEEALKEEILGALKNLPGAPTEAEIAQWKQIHGQDGVYVIALNQSDVFVFTYLRRANWKKIQDAAVAAQNSGGQNSDDFIKEKTVAYSVLWPRKIPMEFWYSSRAGTLDSLFNVIMAHSSFIQLNQAMILTTQL